MGQIMLDIYEAVKVEDGFRAQMRLAMLTGLANQQAASAPDTPDMIEKFVEAYREITGRSCPPALLGGLER